MRFLPLLFATALSGCVVAAGMMPCAIGAPMVGNVTCAEARRLGAPECANVKPALCQEILRSKYAQKVDLKVQTTPQETPVAQP